MYSAGNHFPRPREQMGKERHRGLAGTDALSATIFTPIQT